MYGTQRYLYNKSEGVGIMFGSGRMVRDSKQVLFFGIPYYHEKSSERAVGVDNAENGAWGFASVKLTPTKVEMMLFL